MTTSSDPIHGRAEAESILVAAADALAEASRLLWRRARGHPSPVALESLALGIQLLQADVCSLLAGDSSHRDPELTAGTQSDVVVPPQWDDEIPQTATALLTETERLLRTIVCEDIDLIHHPGLVVDLCELLREARLVDG